MTIRQFNYPTTMLYGPGAVGELGKRLADLHAGETLLLVTDPGLVDVGMAREVVDHLRGWGLGIVEFSDVHGNPTEADVLAGVDASARLGSGERSPPGGDGHARTRPFGQAKGRVQRFDALG